MKWAACRSRVAPASPSAATARAAYWRRLSRRTTRSTPPRAGLRTGSCPAASPRRLSEVGVPVAATCSAASSVHAPTKARACGTACVRARRAGRSPLEGGAQRAVPGGRVAGVGGQHRHAVAQPVGELGGGEELRPRGGQLQGEGEAVEPSADLGDGPARWPAVTAKAGCDAAHPRDEHRDRGHRDQAVEVGDVVGAGDGERRRPGTPFRGEVQPLAARHEQPDPRAGAQRLGEVEPAASTCSQLSTTSSTSCRPARRSPGAVTRPPGASGSPNARATWRATRPGSCTGARSTKTTPSANRGDRLGRHGEGEAGLADAGRAGEGEQAPMSSRTAELGEWRLGVTSGRGEFRVPTVSRARTTWARQATSPRPASTSAPLEGTGSVATVYVYGPHNLPEPCSPGGVNSGTRRNGPDREAEEESACTRAGPGGLRRA